jgi:hypothetical protein
VQILLAGLTNEQEKIIFKEEKNRLLKDKAQKEAKYLSEKSFSIPFA